MINKLKQVNALNEILRLFNALEDEVLDNYSEGNISLEDMKNVIIWCEKMKNQKILENNND